MDSTPSGPGLPAPRPHRVRSCGKLTNKSGDTVGTTRRSAQARGPPADPLGGALGGPPHSRGVARPTIGLLDDVALFDRLLGNPDTLDGPGLARGVRRGSESFAVRCLRAMGERGDAAALPFLSGQLGSPFSAYRRAAATGLGNLGRAEALADLERAWDVDRTEEGRLAIAIARVRCGADPEGVVATLARFERRSVHTFNGPRSPQAAVGASTLVDRFWQALGDAPGTVEPREALLRRRRAAVDTESGGREGRADVQSLAALRHPDDHLRIERLFRSAGRREEHTIHVSLGMGGDPRALHLLANAMFATDVDPARGFAQRRLCATAMGRLGLREATPLLERALENEAADFEGRPGAGMGVQYPVRTNLLWAMGEVADPTTLAILISYLANTSGSAFGGFYLPAMDALTKFGTLATVPLTGATRHRDEVAAANAVGVLAAIGEDVSRFASDPRGAVARVAHAAGARP